jgi:TonB-dependent receptor
MKNMQGVALRHAHKSWLLGGIAAATLTSAGASAQSAPVAATAEVAEAAGGEGEIIVSGSRPIRESQEAALKAQRESPSLVSVVSADAVGRLPDQNIAQAISRLPGVAVQRDQGQARYVNLRGAPLNWTTLSFDGINIISPEGRDARFDSIPSAIAAQIVVRKAVTPDMTSETIAGNVNIITRSAFDYTGFHMAARAGAGYVDLGGGGEYEGTLVLSNRWNTGIGEIGAVFSGSFYQRQMATDNFETDWEVVEQDKREQLTGGELPRVRARETENKLYRLTRKNYSVSGRLEWRPDSDNKLFVTSIYSAFTDNELRSNFIFDFDDQQSRVPQAITACPTTAFLAPNTTGYADTCVGNTPFFGLVNGIDINHNALSREFVQSVFVNTLGGDHQISDTFKISWRGNYTQSIDNRSAPAQINYDSPGFGTNGAGAINRPSVTYNLGNPQQSNVGLFRTLRAADGTLSRGDRVRQIEDFPLSLTRIRGLKAKDTTNAYSAKLDMSYVSDLFGNTRISFGGQYDNRRKSVDERLLDVSAATLFNGQNVLALAGVPTGVAAIAIPGAYKGALPIGYDFRYFGRDQITTLVRQVEPYAAYNFNNGNFYDVRENVYSGYLMGLTSFDWGNAIYGARLEHVENSAQAFATIVGTAAALVTARSSFTAVYPSLHINWNVNAENKVRLSFNTGAARPDYPVLRPNVTINDANQTISGGNPAAVPEKTIGVDLYWEYYPSFGGFASLGGYYKKSA